MLNNNLKLNPHLFDADVELTFMRDGFGEGVLQAGYDDPNVVVLTADLAKSTKVKDFADKFPDRFFEVGVAEQNLVTVASGLASVGKIPFATSYAIFSPGRNWEQIRTTICYNNQPVKIIGSHAGITVGEDGATHQALEDIALMRVIPNMVVVCPADSIEAKKATLALAKLNKPGYLRLSRNETPVMTSLETPFEIGKAQVFNEGKDVAIIATGAMVYQALLAARELELSKISVRVINCSTIKPLDERLILQAAEDCRALVTVEEHQIAGGLGGLVAELTSAQFPVPIQMVGIRDKFGESGTPMQLLQKYGLTVEEIVKSVISVLRMKGK